MDVGDGSDALVDAVLLVVFADCFSAYGAAVRPLLRPAERRGSAREPFTPYRGSHVLPPADLERKYRVASNGRPVRQPPALELGGPQPAPASQLPRSHARASVCADQGKHSVVWQGSTAERTR